MINIRKPKSRSCDVMSVESKNLKYHSNRNNNRVHSGDDMHSTNGIPEMEHNTKKSADPFSSYLKLIKQLRHSRLQKLRSISCQSEKKCPPNARPMNKRRESQSDLNVKRTIPRSDMTGKTPNNKVEHKKQDQLYTFIDAVNHKTTTNDSANDDSRIRNLEKLIKSIVEKINNNQAMKEVGSLDQKYTKKFEKRHKLKSSSKSIQVEAPTQSKSVDIDERDLDHSYINTLADFVSITVIAELQKEIHYQFCDYFLKQRSLGYRNSVKMLLNVEGDCEVKAKTSTAQVLKELDTLQSTKIQSQQRSALITLKEIHNVLMDCSKHLKVLDPFTDNTSEIISTNDDFLDRSNIMRPPHSKNTTIEISDDSYICDNKNSHHIHDRSVNSLIHAIQIKSWNTLSVDNTKAKNSKMPLKSQKLTRCVSSSSSDNSLVNAITTLDVIDDVSCKYRTNCWSMFSSEAQRTSMNEYQPIIHKHGDDTHCQPKPTFTTPTITIGICRSNSDSSNGKLNNNHLKNQFGVSKTIEKPEPEPEVSLNVDEKMVPVGCNQSQSYLNSTNNFLFSYANCSQSQYDTTNYLAIQDNVKRSARITVINPSTKYQKLRVLNKCNYIFDEKCLLMSKLFNTVDDVIEGAHLKAETNIEIAFCSENYFSQIELRVFKDSPNTVWTSLKVDLVLHSNRKMNRPTYVIGNNERKSWVGDYSRSCKNYEFKEFGFSNNVQESFPIEEIANDHQNLKKDQSDHSSSRLICEKEPFPNRCGIKSLYRAIFQSWIFQ